ncbi:MAG: NADH-quinone oxidoreductase subunit L [Burkholderiales bacterium]
MSLTPKFILLMLGAAAPILLWAMGFFGNILTGKHAQRIARLSSGASSLAFLCSALAAILYAISGKTLTVTPYSLILPGNMGALALTIYINAVTVIMLCLVSFVGFVVARYARNYLKGEKHQGRFYTWLNLTLASILTLIVSGNMLMFVLAWMTTSLCLHHLLMFYPEREGAVLAARKKIIASRLGELCLLIAVLLIGSTLHTMEFNELFPAMAAWTGPLPSALKWASMLIVLAAALKSAQFPLHGWLMQVMEAPTPVSALLHAGIVNGGAFLIIRMSPIMSQATAASDILAIIGLSTIAVAALVMQTQTSLKVFLAWTTTAQMGFMLLECGLGLYSLAMLHLVTHSLYKAHAFLSSGSGVDNFRAPSVKRAHATPALWQWLVVVTFAALMTAGTGYAFGITVTTQPALLGSGIIVVVAMTQFLLQSFMTGIGPTFILRAAALSAVVCTAYFSLHAAFHLILQTSLPAVRISRDPVQFVLIGMILLVFFAIILIQQNLPKLARYPVARRAYVHLYNGLYVDIPFSRLVQWLFPVHVSQKGVKS